jgi:hypothetical protein
MNGARFRWFCTFLYFTVPKNALHIRGVNFGYEFWEVQVNKEIPCAVSSGEQVNGG